MKPSEFNAQIYEEACTWFIDMRAGDVDATGRRRFDAWARKSPEHLRAYLEVSEVWDDVALVDPKKEVTRNDLIAHARASAEIVSLRGRTGPRWLTAASRAGRHGVKGFNRPWRWGLAAGLVALTVAVGFTFLQLMRTPTFTTAIGEQRTITLSDGSRVEMNSRTRLAVHFAEHERGIELFEGQAFFHVAKNPERPFVVRADGVSVRAVGTQFDVYRKADGTVVTVVEGKVAVVAPVRAPEGAEGTTSPLPASAAPPTHPEPRLTDGSGTAAVRRLGESVSYVAAGEQLTVTAQAVTRPAHPDIAAATAWTHGSLVFSGSRLADVIAEFNRYNERQLVIHDSSLGDIRISGVYASTDPALLVRFLRDQPGITVDDSGGSIVISAK